MILISTVTCGRNKSIQLDQQDLIRFGHGGGIFGREYVFFLKRDGSIFGPDTKPVQLSANQLKQVIKNIGFFKLRSNSYNQPGNIYQFIEVENENHVWSRIVWDPHDPNAPDELQLFYNFVFHFLKT
ncbi:MAG: hypothetical protein IPH93_10670 [Saprospiraceae bacterium]|nr:hypothetical protein [Saprospiraceae bacterium]